VDRLSGPALVVIDLLHAYGLGGSDIGLTVRRRRDGLRIAHDMIGRFEVERVYPVAGHAAEEPARESRPEG